MKKRILITVCIVLTLTAGIAIGTKWSDYSDMTGGTIADADTFLIRDVSDTSLAATGTQKEYPWSVMKADLDLIYQGLAAGLTSTVPTVPGIRTTVAVPHTPLADALMNASGSSSSPT